MKNFVFDLYGTLVDIRTDESCAKFRQKFIDGYGAYFGNVNFFKRYGEIMGSFPKEAEPDVIKVFMQIAEEGGQTLSLTEAENIATNFRKLSLQKLKVYPFVRSTLRGLRRKGAKIYILSNAQAAFTCGEIAKFGLGELCDGIELSSDFGKKKPAGEFFLYAAQKYKLNLAETLYVGNDMECDVRGAKSAGLKTAYIRTKISPRQDTLEAAKQISDYTAKNHFRLKNLLLSLC